MFNLLKYTAVTLVLIGALNWGLVGFFGFDLVAFIFGNMTLLTRLIYALVGLSSIVALFCLFRMKNTCHCYED